MKIEDIEKEWEEIKDDLYCQEQSEWPCLYASELIAVAKAAKTVVETKELWYSDVRSTKTLRQLDKAIKQLEGCRQ